MALPKQLMDSARALAVRNADTWREIGKHFGYPDCCIESFVEFRHLQEPEFKQLLPGTGFINCEACAEKYTAKQMIDVIKQERECKVPFPHANRMCLGECGLEED